MFTYHALGLSRQVARVASSPAPFERSTPALRVCPPPQLMAIVGVDRTIVIVGQWFGRGSGGGITFSLAPENGYPLAPDFLRRDYHSARTHHYQAPFENGNLFIIMNIEFPTEINAQVTQTLLKLLPPPKHTVTTPEDDDDAEVVELSDIDPVRSYKDHLPEEVDDDEAGGGEGGQRVQCAQQ